MSLGTILASVAALVLVVAYVARPFRRKRVDIDRVIERWMRQVRSATVAVDEAAKPTGTDADAAAQHEADSPVSHLPADAGVMAAGEMDQDEPVNFCPYCGRRVEPDHVFCPKCGKQLADGESL